MINNIVTYTNRYAELMKTLPQIQERMQEKERSLFSLWLDITADELWTYFGVQLIMGIVHKPTLPMYWSKEPIFATPITSRLMRRDRFEQIRKMVHFTDPLSEDPLNSLRKLDTFMNSLREKFIANYTPTKFVAVDEYLSLWKGRLSFKIYFPNKRERYGVKIYMLCESSTGYLSKFIVYCIVIIRNKQWSCQSHLKIIKILRR